MSLLFFLFFLKNFQQLNPLHFQILSKHKNEIRGIKQILRETRACRNHLAKQLQTTEHKLLHTKANLQHLEVLSRDRHLWEREELSVRLSEVTTELQEKQRRISVLYTSSVICSPPFLVL